MTRLKDDIIRLIRLDGPISVERYMALCLSHPTLGYYTTRDPFGTEGDFITAPEISQMFGELIGLWAGQVWLDMGNPARVGLIEIGPGRGTLMADALRAMCRAIPQIRQALDVCLVETSPVLRARQQSALANAGLPVRWAQDIVGALPPQPTIVVANELLDALPVRQFQMTAEGWRERLIGVDGTGEIAIGLSEPVRAALPGDPPPGTIIERCEAAETLARDLARHVATHGGAALLIDYGSAQDGAGDTLQAVKRHRFVDPLAEPGEADLTTQVNFARIAAAGQSAGVIIHGPISQGEFLVSLGLHQRAAALRMRATSEQAERIERDVARLTDMAERGMGALFKALAFSPRTVANLPGFG